MCYLDFKQNESGEKHDFSLMNLKEIHVKIIKAGVDVIYNGMITRKTEHTEDYENRRAANELIIALSKNNENKDN